MKDQEGHGHLNKPVGHTLTKNSIEDVGREIVRIKEMEDFDPEAIITQRVHIPAAKIEQAITFWKPLYFNYKKDKRLLNGIEAYELGDPKITPSPNAVPYIAMCNLITLEALLRMGDQSPTVEAATDLAYATEREREIADFWHKTFYPTEFQVEWAWTAAMAVMAGDPIATNEILEDYRQQLP